MSSKVGKRIFGYLLSCLIVFGVSEFPGAYGAANQDASGAWYGIARIDGTELPVVLEVTKAGATLTGTLTCDGKAGTSKHFVEGGYDKESNQYVLHDIRVEKASGRADWTPILVDHYTLQVADGGESLLGSCHQVDFEDMFVLELGKNKQSMTRAQRTHQSFLQAEKAKALLDAEEFAKAKAVYEEACKLDPNDNSASIHTDLGFALQSLGDTAGAIAQYNRALEFNSQSEAPLFNIAGCNLLSGKQVEAQALLERFIDEHPDSLRCAEAKSFLEKSKSQAADPKFVATAEAIEKGEKEPIVQSSQYPKDDGPTFAPSTAPKPHAKMKPIMGVVSDVNDGRPDYLSSIIENGTCRWAKEAMPIKVYIKPCAKVRGYKEKYNQYLVKSFEEWIAASEGRISCVLVEKEEDANIVCSWTAKKSDFQKRSLGEQGETAVLPGPADENGQRTIKSATIKICTVNTFGLLKSNGKDVASVCRHEVGHALGLQGHSPHFTDVMFPAKLSTTVWVPIPVTISAERRLSQRDKATLAHLYQAYPRSRHYVMDTAPSVTDQSSPDAPTTKHKIF
jgi:tetratricopeptide (TPR) repeat protein